ncbi:hypothetical protein ATK30_0611 [Amycolatopsis echigonensis]|uniref:Uncharacterized protein n=1 Tax=Amycolatopsis echigonensis TaxID=2576905 RepID=A0A2N3X0I8_9PSEU|nr:hypothetical protein ATK30_0611 [Amycolatopsis niigatensis]
MTVPGAENAGQAPRRTEKPDTGDDRPYAVTVSQHPGRVTVTFHEPGMPQLAPAVPSLRPSTRPAYPSWKTARTSVELAAQQPDGATQPWQLIAVLLTPLVGATAIVFATAGVPAGLATAGGVVLMQVAATVLRKRHTTNRRT